MTKELSDLLAGLPKERFFEVESNQVFSNSEDIVVSIEKAGYKFYSRTEKLLHFLSYPLGKEGVKWKIAFILNTELGFFEKTQIKVIYEKISSLGINKMPMELPFYYALRHKITPLPKGACFAVEPIYLKEDLDDLASVFHLELLKGAWSSGTSCFSSFWGHPSYCSEPEMAWAVVIDE